jgi:hypothetical protein
MAENGPTARIAEKLSSKLLKRFFWNEEGPYNADFDCVQSTKHAIPTKEQKHQHPVDVVFSYKDPYLGKRIYLNTDLKSYSRISITASNIEAALVSLAKTIECARHSPEWRERYHAHEGAFDVRGMLFVYNHDNEYRKGFYEVMCPPKEFGAKKTKGKNPKGVPLENIPIASGQQIHIIDPMIILYMTTIVADMDMLHQNGRFPEVNYSFFYPNLTLHKVCLDEEHLPATIEAICAPFLIVKYDDVIKFNEKTGEAEVRHPKGYIIYYNRSGSTDNEFLYLLDMLSKYQILNSNCHVNIRVAHREPAKNINSNYDKAKNRYASDWGFSNEMKRNLDKVALSTVSVSKEQYFSEDIGWER